MIQIQNFSLKFTVSNF